MIYLMINNWDNPSWVKVINEYIVMLEYLIRHKYHIYLQCSYVRMLSSVEYTVGV